MLGISPGEGQHRTPVNGHGHLIHIQAPLRPEVDIRADAGFFIQITGLAAIGHTIIVYPIVLDAVRQSGSLLCGLPLFRFSAGRVYPLAGQNSSHKDVIAPEFRCAVRIIHDISGFRIDFIRGNGDTLVVPRARKFHVIQFKVNHLLGPGSDFLSFRVINQSHSHRIVNVFFNAIFFEFTRINATLAIFRLDVLILPHRHKLSRVALGGGVGDGKVFLVVNDGIGDAVAAL